MTTAEAIALIREQAALSPKCMDALGVIERALTWQPIASAPEDAPVLVDCELGFRVAVKQNARWWSGHDEYGNYCELEQVKRWMAIPAPPEAKA